MALLEVSNLYKRFGDNEVLKSVSFSAEKGEVICIIGSSGGGKTTLLRCLNLLETPDGGSITVDGDTVFNSEDSDAISDAEMRRRRLHFGLVFQQFNLFPQYNVFDNVCLAPKLMSKESGKTAEEIESTARELLAKVGLTEKSESFPYSLSGGQQQRVAIARALAQNPDILCFDEPTSALDPELTGEVLRVIKGLKSHDSTMIIVTHEMEFARSVSDKIIFIADGTIEEFGTPEEVFDHPKSEKMKSFLKHTNEF